MRGPAVKTHAYAYAADWPPTTPGKTLEGVTYISGESEFKFRTLADYEVNAWAPLAENIILTVAHHEPAASVVTRQTGTVEEQLRAVFGYAKLFDQLCRRVESLEAKIEQVLNRLGELSSARKSFLVPIETLAPEPYEILRPLTVVITECEGGFEASLFDASIFASGETEEEAFANLKETLIDTYDRLNELSDTQLGPTPLRQKQLLNKYIGKTGPR